MPIDPSIPLGVQAPPAINVFGLQQQAQQFQLGRQQAQALAAERQATAEDTRQKAEAAKRANADEAAVRQYFATITDPNQPLDPSSPEFNRLASQVGFDRASNISKGIDALKQQNLKTEGDVRSMFGAAIGGIKALPPQMQPDAYNTVVQHYAQRGLIDPAHVAPYSPQVLDQYQQQAMTPTEQTANVRADAAQAATLPGQRADSAVKAQVAAGTKNGLTPEQQATAAVAAATARETARAHRATEANAAGELAIKNRTFDATYGSGLDGNGQPLSPEAKLEQAKNDPSAVAIANYMRPPITGRASVTGIGKATMDRAQLLNPAYDGTQFQGRQRARIAFTSGTQGQQVTAMNTAIQHLDMLSAAADALKNGNFKPGNALYNSFQSTFGAAPPSNYDEIKRMVDGEVEAVVSKGVPTVSGMKAQEGTAGSASSPDQIKGFIDTTIPLMGSKLNALRYSAGTSLGEKDPLLDKLLSPEAKAVLAKRGYDPNNPGGSKAGSDSSGSVSVKAPNGKTYTFKSQADADAFKQKAGIS